MVSEIRKINEDGKIDILASYSTDPKTALVSYLEQQNNNFNTWKYENSTFLDKIKESKSKKFLFYIPNNKNESICSFSV